MKIEDKIKVIAEKVLGLVKHDEYNAYVLPTDSKKPMKELDGKMDEEVIVENIY